MRKFIQDEYEPEIRTGMAIFVTFEFHSSSQRQRGTYEIAAPFMISSLYLSIISKNLNLDTNEIEIYQLKALTHASRRWLNTASKPRRAEIGNR